MFLKNDSFKIPLWIRSFQCSIGEFRLPFWLVLIAFIGMLSWSLFTDLDSVDMNVWDESLFAMRAYQLFENGSFLQNFNQFSGLYDHPSTKLPFVTLIQVGSFYIFGPSVWALRFPIGVIAILSILWTIRILFRLGIESKWGMLMGFILLGSPGFLGEHMLRTGDHDAPLAFFLLLAGLYFFEYAIRNRKRSLWGLLFFFIAALLTKNLLAGTVVPSWLLFALLYKQFIPLIKDMRMYMAALLAIGLYVLIIWGFELNYPGFVQRMWNYELLGRYTQIIEGHTGPWYYYWQSLFQSDFNYAMISAIMLFPIVWEKRKTETGKLAIFLGLMGIFYLLIISFSQTKLPWYHAPVFPVFSLFVAISLCILWQRFNTDRFFKSSRKVRVTTFLIPIFWVVLWFQNSKDVHARNGVFGPSGHLELFKKIEQDSLLLKHTYLVEDDFGSDTYFYTKSFEAFAFPNQFYFSRNLDTLNSGDGIMVIKPWLLDRISLKYHLDTICELNNARYVRIKSIR